MTNDAKGPLGNADRFADLVDFAFVLDLAERLDEALGQGERGCFRAPPELLERADRDVIRLDAQARQLELRERLEPNAAIATPVLRTAIGRPGHSVSSCSV